MFRIDSAGHQNNRFVQKDPANGVPGTVIAAEWLNSQQEELVKIVLDAGIALDKNNQGQVMAAILKHIGNQAVVRLPTLDSAAAIDFATGQVFHVTGQSAANDGLSGSYLVVDTSNGYDVELNNGKFARYVHFSNSQLGNEVPLRYNPDQYAGSLYKSNDFAGDFKPLLPAMTREGFSLHRKPDGNFQYSVDVAQIIGTGNYHIYISTSGTGSLGRSLDDAISFTQFKSNIDADLYPNAGSMYVHLMDEVYRYDDVINNLTEIGTLHRMFFQSNSPSGFTWLTTAESNLTWSESGGVYSATAEPYTVCCLDEADAQGMPIIYEEVATPGDLVPGTWTQDGATVRVMPFASRSGIEETLLAVRDDYGFTVDSPTKPIFFRDIGWITGSGHSCLHSSVSFEPVFFERCRFLAGRNDAYSVVGATYYVVMLSCIGAYSGKDCFNYHSTATASGDAVAVEVNCTGYFAGKYKYAGGNTTTNSNNGSTGHDGMSIYRFGCQYWDCEGPNVADANGCLSVCYGVRSVGVITSTTGNSGTFYFYESGAPAFAPKMTVLVGCYGAGDDVDYSFSTEGNMTTLVDGLQGDLSKLNFDTAMEIF